MSGGSFNYLFLNLIDNPFGDSELSDLKSMKEWLKSKNKNDAVWELRLLLEEITETKEYLEKKINDLTEVMKAAELWASNDISEDSFDEELKKYEQIAYNLINY